MASVGSYMERLSSAGVANRAGPLSGQVYSKDAFGMGVAYMVDVRSQEALLHARPGLRRMLYQFKKWAVQKYPTYLHELTDDGSKPTQSVSTHDHEHDRLLEMTFWTSYIYRDLQGPVAQRVSTTEQEREEFRRMSKRNRVREGCFRKVEQLLDQLDTAETERRLFSGQRTRATDGSAASVLDFTDGVDRAEDGAVGAAVVGGLMAPVTDIQRWMPSYCEGNQRSGDGSGGTVGDTDMRFRLWRTALSGNDGGTHIPTATWLPHVLNGMSTAAVRTWGAAVPKALPEAQAEVVGRSVRPSSSANVAGHGAESVRAASWAQGVWSMERPRVSVPKKATVEPSVGSNSNMSCFVSRVARRTLPPVVARRFREDKRLDMYVRRLLQLQHVLWRIIRRRRVAGRSGPVPQVAADADTCRRVGQTLKVADKLAAKLGLTDHAAVLSCKSGTGRAAGKNQLTAGERVVLGKAISRLHEECKTFCGTT